MLPYPYPYPHPYANKSLLRKPLKFAAAALTALTLASCAQVSEIERADVKQLLLLDVGNVPQNTVDPVWYAAVSAGLMLWPDNQQAVQEPQDIVLSPEQISEIPFAANYFRLENQLQILAILAFPNRIGDDPSSVRLQWATQYNDAAETDAVGRLLSLEMLFAQPSASHFAGDNSALRCYGKAAQGLLAATSCPQQGQWAYDMTLQIDATDQTAQALSYDTRESATVSYQVVSTTAQLTMPNGESVRAWHVREQANDGRFSNDFYLDPRNGKSLKAKQWLGSALGYLESEQVVLWATPATAVAPPLPNLQQVNTAVGPVQVLPGARMAALYDALNQATSSANYFSPLLRVHSCELEQQLQARKAGMLVRLRLLQQSYRADGNQQGLEAAEALEQQFNSWPLKATYLPGFSAAKSRFDLALNPKLPQPEQANCPVSLAFGQPQPAQSVGLVEQGSDSAWVIRANGEIRNLNLANEDARKQHSSLLQQPNSIVFYGIDEADLPPGFKDLNQQMSLFLQHWDFAHGQ